jgi:hypothetical protein
MCDPFEGIEAFFRKGFTYSIFIVKVVVFSWKTGRVKSGKNEMLFNIMFFVYIDNEQVHKYALRVWTFGQRICPYGHIVCRYGMRVCPYRLKVCPYGHKVCPY